MTIGCLAKAAGVNIETVRYYQRRGLIEEPRKPAGGQRRYSESTVAKLAFVRRAQQLGFTLAEIGELFRFAEANDREGVRRVAEARYTRLALHAQQLKAMCTRLKALLDESRRRKGRGSDPIIAVLHGEEASASTDPNAGRSGSRRAVAASG